MNLSLREALITEAEEYERLGEPLPLDLYSSLMAQGIDASLYNNPQDIEEGDISDDNH